MDEAGFQLRMATGATQGVSKIMQEIDGADTTASTLIHNKMDSDNEQLDDDEYVTNPHPSPEPSSSKETSVSTGR